MKKPLVKIFAVLLLLYVAEVAFGWWRTHWGKHGELLQILSTGQSLSVGATGKPVLTTVQPFENLMLDRSGRALIPLVEPSNNLSTENGETMGSSMANRLSFLNGNSFQTVVTNHGNGGFEYEKLKKGSWRYALGMQQLEAVHNEAFRTGKTHKVIGVTVVHGENDQSGIWDNWEYWKSKGFQEPADVYASFLKQWQQDYARDIRNVTGQENVPLYTDQMSSHTGAGSKVPISALGQLKAAKENPGKIILVGPKYFLTYNDNFHLNNYSYRLLGEYYAKVMNQVFVQGKTWLPLLPVNILRMGNVIYVKFHVPEPATKIVFDTQNVDAMPNMGFEYQDASGTVAIQNVEIVGNDMVKIVLNDVPKDADEKFLRYAYTGTPGANPGAHSAGSAKGNLRDDDNEVSMYDPNVHLWDWAVHFSEKFE